MVTPSVFCSIPCLTERSRSFSASELTSKWFSKRDKRYIDRTVQDFLNLNSSLLDFIGVTPIVSGSFKDLSLSFRSGSFIGAIPLKSPDDGKPFADFLVYPRYINEAKENVNEYIEIIYLLEKEIDLEFRDSSNLLTKNQARPPIYYECVKFIDLFLKTIQENWVSFNSSIEINKYPRNQISWRQYLKDEWDPIKKLEYPCRINTLNKYHNGMMELLYVYNLSKNHVLDHNTPITIRKSSIKKCFVIDNYFSTYKPLQTDKLVIHNSDPYLIKQTKDQANKILGYESQVNIAWRVDFTNIFEKYIQYIFNNISQRLGWKTKNNPKYKSYSDSRPTWSLQYLEPDIVISKGKYSVTIDAKYKSHYYNIDSSSDNLKLEHRNDLHQITAYCAFQINQKKVGFLCYPASFFDSKRMIFNNSQALTDVVIYLFGIPISSTNINGVIDKVQKQFIDIVNKEKLI